MILKNKIKQIMHDLAHRGKQLCNYVPCKFNNPPGCFHSHSPHSFCFSAITKLFFILIETVLWFRLSFIFLDDELIFIFRLMDFYTFPFCLKRSSIVCQSCRCFSEISKAVQCKGLNLLASLSVSSLFLDNQCVLENIRKTVYWVKDL